VLQRSWVIAISLVLLLLTALVPAASAAPAADVSYQQVLAGYASPVYVTHASGVGDVLFVVEQGGKIKRARFKDGAWRKVGTFLDIRDRVSPLTLNLELGLLGVAFHPNYRQNGRFYVAYTRGAGAPDLESVVSEFRRTSPGKAAPSSERILMVVKQRNDHHNVSRLTFGPDGLLYIASGDGGGGTLGEQGQDLRSKYGKILRIDPRDPDGAGKRRFSIPRSNPYVGKYGLDTIWSMGLRNPWGISFDRKSGDLWIGDVGQGLREEVDRSRSNARGLRAGRGADYGWDSCQGSLEYADDENDEDPLCEQGVLPLYEYAHDAEHCAVIGGSVYRGPEMKRWRGLYVGADWCGSLFVIDQRGREVIAKSAPQGIVAIGDDKAGRLFAVHRQDGTISRIVFSGVPTRP
jgi:glucose/arabinose dehydrogenase